jgi:hypothetical protein
MASLKSSRQPSSLIHNAVAKVTFQNDDRHSEGMLKATWPAPFMRHTERGGSLGGFPAPVR